MSRALAASCLVLFGTSCAPPGTAPLPHAGAGALPSHLRVQLAPGGRVHAVPLDDYTAGVVAAEAGVRQRDGTAAERMLEVQAIVARSYGVAHRSRHARQGFDLCSTTHCQVFEPRLGQTPHTVLVQNAVRRTSRMILWHGSRPASAVFHADCGGHTSAARDIWGSDTHPYLAATRDDGPAEPVHRTWRFDVAPDELLRALDRTTRTRLGQQLVDVTVAARDTAGRALRVRLHGTAVVEVRGEDFRATVNRAYGPGALLSTRLEIRRSGAALRFQGRGHGHGVGLCQVGAMARVRQGSSVEAVLARYYPGTRLARAP